ncbi:glycosyltransferase family 4 protein [Sphingobacterium humi]|uniref:Glycosyltransferase n=1 Tax=Sphingobacterium humi TaxID=1796905 RepID=A0A6N8L310_9SPHI|nr:glycosyltransferase family 4 protein [Sphingobacterium humi]MVZ62891.1 glycosyltransferase [Sphingobacterium humi]
MSTTKPEILFVSHKYPPATGGMEKQSYELIQGVSVLSKVHYLVYKKGKGSLLRFFWSLNKQILQLLKAHPGIQLIHFNDGLLAAVALFHRGYAHIKRAVTIHGLDVVFPLPYFQQHILPKFNRYDLIIAVSEATAQAAIARGIQPEKVQVINNGVDRQLAQQGLSRELLAQRYPVLQTGKPYMLTLGRPVKRKGFSWLLDKVWRDMPGDVLLLMVGPFQQRAPLSEKLLQLLPRSWRHLLSLFLGYPSDARAIRKLLRDPQLAPRLQHLGKVPLAELQALLAHASAFLMPNIEVPGDMEGFGLVCLEASLAGSLVLAARTEGICDAIRHQQNGLLLPSGDAQAWKAQLQQVFAAPAYYNQQRQAFQAYSAAHYSWEEMAQAYLVAFQGCCQPSLSASGAAARQAI